MEMPIDRGYAVISRDTEGTVTVQIATAIENSQPVGVFAKYVGAGTVWVDPVIQMVKTAAHEYTTSVVEVSSGDGMAVTLMAPTRWLDV